MGEEAAKGQMWFLISLKPLGELQSGGAELFGGMRGEGPRARPGKPAACRWEGGGVGPWLGVTKPKASGIAQARATGLHTELSPSGP